MRDSIIQGDQKVSVHLMITIQSSGAQRLCDHPVQSLLVFIKTVLIILQQIIVGAEQM